MASPGSGLVTPSPPRPGQDQIRRLVICPYEAGEQPAHLRQCHWNQLLIRTVVAPFPSCSIVCCLTTARQAWASIASVMCRYQPSHRRTSYWSSPTPAFAGAGSVPWPPQSIPRWPTLSRRLSPVPPGWSRLGQSTRSKPSPPVWLCCGGPAANGPCQAPSGDGYPP